MSDEQQAEFILAMMVLLSKTNGAPTYHASIKTTDVGARTGVLAKLDGHVFNMVQHKLSDPAVATQKELKSAMTALNSGFKKMFDGFGDDTYKWTDANCVPDAVLQRLLK